MWWSVRSPHRSLQWQKNLMSTHLNYIDTTTMLYFQYWFDKWDYENYNTSNQATKHYLESESVLDDDFFIAQPELTAVKIYKVDNFKSALRIQKTGVRSDSAIENKQREFYIVFCNSKQKAIVLYTLSCGGVGVDIDIWTKLKKWSSNKTFHKAVHNLVTRT